MIPFLKKKQEGGMAQDEDQGEDFSILDAVASDMLEAIHKKDKALLKQALESFQEHLKSDDENQDLLLTNKE